MKYEPEEKSKYNEKQYKNLVLLSAILDFKLQGKEFIGQWFKSSDLMLEDPYFSDPDNRHIQFVFAPQQFMRHNVFYDPAELEVL